MCNKKLFIIIIIIITSQVSLFHPSWFWTRNSYMYVQDLANILGYM